MSFSFFCRAVSAMFLRFFVIIAIGVFYENFEVSPLPAWTLNVFVVLLGCFATYIFTRWVIGKIIPLPGEVILLYVLFLVVESFLEGALSIYLTQASWTSIFANYSWGSLLILICYGASVALAVWHKRRLILASQMPEGLS